MSDYGLKINNTKSEIQIDSLYSNYLLEKTGSISSLEGLSAVNIENNLYPPIAAIKPTSDSTGVCGVFDVSYSSPYYTGVRFFGGKEGVGVHGTCSFDYKIFTLKKELITSSDYEYGLRIRNSLGNLIYHTLSSPFKILESGTATIGSTYTHSNHSNPYYIFSPCHSAVVCYAPGPPTPPMPIYSLQSGLAKISSTSIQMKWTTCGIIGVAPLGGSSSSGSTVNLLLCE